MTCVDLGRIIACVPCFTVRYSKTLCEINILQSTTPNKPGFNSNPTWRASFLCCRVKLALCNIAQKLF